MTRPPSTRLKRLGATVAAAGVAGLGLAATADAAPARTVDLQILSFNDHHGHLAPPSGNDGLLTTEAGTPPATVPADGVEYLSTHLKTLRQGHADTLTAAAGDLVGGSPFLSGLFKDEPGIESLDTPGLDVSSVGNHEFDEGVPELLLIRYGGCNPVEGCFDADGYAGTGFAYLAANATYKDGVTPARPAGAPRYGRWFRSSTGRTVLPPTTIRTVSG